MRLTRQQQQSILHIIHENFGCETNVWLFGSRTDDNQRGGDVDLYVESRQTQSLLSELQCKIILEQTLDLPVDLIIKQPGKDKPIYHIAKQQGIQL